ncbi:hypothetical protein tinsulaeT_04920 [Thalassotalea insulae]|uniref:Uncharacterized protein n=1 Tax=Thalassotalea insulae TaxID=2056778 RepID=A0ABQ6GP69_9GAMM|nr:hypothetical protein [Thalassotalea insulae]GLX77152.1 hypothetical protein tinsulaeT_04920 [Thalassotalea insulae]
MALFSWFIGTQNAKDIANKNSQLDVKEATFSLNTMWPTAKVRRNAIVKQQEFTNSLQDKNSTIKSTSLKEKES